MVFACSSGPSWIHRLTFFVVASFTSIATASVAFSANMQQLGGVASVGSDLKISYNGRYLVYADGTPFFWLADTGWKLMEALKKSEADIYLADRANKGFTVIKSDILPWAGNTPNAYGDPPFRNNDVSLPNDAYFRNVDAVIDSAEQRGLHINLYADVYAIRELTDPEKAYNWGFYLGSRYRAKSNIIWDLGTDHAPEPGELAMMRALAKGIAVGATGSEDYSKIAMTAHHGICADGSRCLRSEAWLMVSQEEAYADEGEIYPQLIFNYNLEPAKPAAISETWYEAQGDPTATAYDIRRAAYWSFLAGGYYTYGAWPIYKFGSGWQDNLNLPGASSMTVYKQLLATRAWWKYVPAQSIITSGQGSGNARNAAAISSDGSSIIAYMSNAGPITIDMSKITSGTSVRARWFDPRDGQETAIGSFPNSGTQDFLPPPGWQDAVLLLDAL